MKLILGLVVGFLFAHAPSAEACGFGNCYPMQSNPFVGSSWGGDGYMDDSMMMGQWPVQDDFSNWDGQWYGDMYEQPYERPSFTAIAQALNWNGATPMGASYMPPMGASAIYNYQNYKQIRDQMEYQMYSTPGY